MYIHFLMDRDFLFNFLNISSLLLYFPVNIFRLQFSSKTPFHLFLKAQLQFPVHTHDDIVYAMIKGKFMHFSKGRNFPNFGLYPTLYLFHLPAIIVFNIPASCQVGNFPLKTSSSSSSLLLMLLAP